MKFRPCSALSCQTEVSSDGARRGGRRYALRIIAIAALALAAVLTACPPALAQQPAPATPVVPAASSDRPIGLPPVRDYAPIPELRDIFFDSGKQTIRPGDAKILAANAAWLRSHPDYLLLIEGHSDNRGAPAGKNESNLDLGERASCNESSRRAGCSSEPHHDPELWGRTATMYRGERTVLESKSAIALSREAALAKEP
jgi:hypothetical protein